MTRRQFAAAIGALAGAATVRPAGAAFSRRINPGDLPASIRRLRPMTAGAEPIRDQERRARIEKAQRLMVEQGIAAILMEPGSSMTYYTGVGWSLSERLFAVLIPARGEPGWICPAFEESRARVLIGSGSDVCTWQEDQCPFRLAADLLRDPSAGCLAPRVWPL